MSYPPSAPPPGGAPSPWAPRGPGGGQGTPGPGGAPTTTWSPPGARPAGAAAPWAAAPAPAPARPGGPTAAPWAPTGWQGQPTNPPAAGGGGLPPYPPGYGAAGSGPVPAPGPTIPLAPPPDGGRGGRLMSALVGGVVGAVVAALVAGGLVLATDDDEPSAEPMTSSTLPRTDDRDGLDVQSILQIAQPSVVSIHTGSSTSPLAEGAGTGFVIDEDGLILTNAHVIAGADEISVTFFDGSSLDAELVGSFPGEDLAMVRVEGREDLRPAVLGSSSDLAVGDDVVAIGNALNLGGQPSVTTGIVSALDRSISAPGISLDNLIQTDAAINPGNSGGPLFNSAGEVVGINTAKIPDASNIGFALSIDSVKPLIDELRAGNGEVNPDQAFLGVSVTPVDNPDLPPEVLEQYGITSMEGVIVTAVTPDSAAGDAGLQEGDVILEIANQTIDSDAALAEVIRAQKPGNVVLVVYERQGERDEVEVTLTRRGG